MNINKFHTAKFLGLRKKVAGVWEDALEHAQADGRCGRQWVCACGACNIIRAEIKRLKDSDTGGRCNGFGRAQTLEGILNGNG